MSTHLNVPADILPEELRGSLEPGSRVTVHITTEDEPIPGYSREELAELLKDVGKGEPIRFESHDDFSRYMRDKLDAALSRAAKRA